MNVMEIEVLEDKHDTEIRTNEGMLLDIVKGYKVI